jgi:hypothetical protein
MLPKDVPIYELSCIFISALTCESNCIAELHSNSRLSNVHFQSNHERSLANVTYLSRLLLPDNSTKDIIILVGT